MSEYPAKNAYTNSVETITVDSVTKYGGKVNGKSYNLGKKYTGPALEAGFIYEVEVSTSPIGAKYINKAKNLGDARKPGLNMPSGTKTVDTAKTVVVGDNNPTRANGSSLSPSEKDTRILVQGILQAVIQSPVLAGAANLAEYKASVYELTEDFVRFVREQK